MDMELDLVSNCKTKLAYFRIKELKDVLNQLGLSKQGKKQDLMDRIVGLISDEEVLIARGSVKRNIGKEGVAKVIDDAYRKMQISEPADSATKGQGGSDICSVKPKIEVGESSTSVVKIFCPCGSSMPTESMIKCVDPSCQVRQHISCVIIPEKPMEGIPPVPPLYFCELCRIKRADPFWVTLENIVSPVKLIASNVPTDGICRTNPLQNVERTFQLSRANRDLLQNTEYDVQAWCILLNDKVSFRMQWPQYADLQVNGIAVRTLNRAGSQILGANGRDDGALITTCIRDGISKISLSGCDSRIFCFGVRLVKRRTVEQVFNLIPKEVDGKLFEDALARVRRCMGGGMATANEDSDSDLEVIADSITVNLRCPMSASRIKVAGRFKPCVHMGCFDLETFVEINQRSRKWQCPICLKNYSLEDIIIDPYFNRITTMMRHCGEDITDIEVKPDGSWSAKTKGELSNLAQWHFPDGSICMAANEVTSNLGTLRQIKNEDDSQGHTNTGRNKNLRGVVEVSKHQHVNLSSRNSMEENFENYDKKVITMSSSASISDRDDEEPSINQDFYGHIDISTDNGNEINSISHNFDPTFGIENQSSAAMVDPEPEVIILSDSEEEDANMVPPESIYQACPVNGGGSSLSAPPEIADSYLEAPALDVGMNSCLGLFNGNGNDIGMSNWPYPSGSRAGSGFQLFGTDSDVSDAFIDLEHSPVTYSGPMNGYTPASKSTIISGGQVLDSSVCHSNIDMDDGLVDNPLAFVNGDPLQNFLPTPPAVVSAQSDLRHHCCISNGMHSEDWVSLRLGSNGESAGSNVGPHAQSVESNGLDMRNVGGSNKAALPTGMNDEARSNKTKNTKMSDGPFSFPRQPRSVRQRVLLSIDSD